MDFSTAENSTARFAKTGQWDSVIYYGEKALEDSIDYFYLRQRIGTAYYKNENYFDAITHFNKALLFNSSDATTLEYLYYCYLFTNRNAERRTLATVMNDNIRKSLNISRINKTVSSIFLNGGAALSNNVERNKSIDINDDYQFYGEADLCGDIKVISLGMTHEISSRLTITHGFQFLQMEKMKIMSAYNQTLGDKVTEITTDSTYYMMPAPPHYIYDTTYNITTSINKILHSDTIYSLLRQVDYYINCSYHTKSGWDIAPYLHYLNAKNETRFLKQARSYYTMTDSIILHTQIWLPGSGGPDIIDTVFVSTDTYTDTLFTYNFPKGKLSISDYAAGISFSKYVGKWYTSFFGSFSSLNYKKQWQAGVDLVFFPKGNLNRYVGGTFTLWKEEQDYRIIGQGVAGLKLAKRIWFEGNASLGRMTNFTGNGGYSVYNNPDPVILSVGISPVFVFNHFNISIQYSFIKKKGHYITGTSENIYLSRAFNYSSQSITGGIQWKF